MYFVFWQMIFSTEFSAFCVLISFNFWLRLSSCAYFIGINSSWSSEGHVDTTKSIAEDTVPTRKGSILKPIKKVLAEIIVVKHPESGELLWNEQMLMHLSKVGLCSRSSCRLSASLLWPLIKVVTLLWRERACLTCVFTPAYVRKAESLTEIKDRIPRVEMLISL